jgi:hypothetical protein
MRPRLQLDRDLLWDVLGAIAAAGFWVWLLWRF